MKTQVDNWSIQDLWNNTVVGKDELTPRSYIRASEIGTSFLDRYYKMHAVPFTNDFDARVLRVFEAGNLFEWLVRAVLVRAGLLHRTQQEVVIPETKEHLEVVGHLDFIGGGEPDWDAARSLQTALEGLGFPTRMLAVAERFVDALVEKYGDDVTFKPLLYEIKSVNSMAFWKHNRNGMLTAYPHHVMQLYTYLKALNMDEGRILYISKDDLTLAELVVRPDKELEAAWLGDVTRMSDYHRNNIEPGKPEDIVWNAAARKYEVNWHMSRSPYLTKIVNMSAEAWSSEMGKLAARANYRVKKVLATVKDAPDAAIQHVAGPYIEKELAGIYGETFIYKPTEDNG